MLRNINGIYFIFWRLGNTVYQAEVEIIGKNFIKKLDTVKPAEAIDPASFIESSCNVQRLQMHHA